MCLIISSTFLCEQLFSRMIRERSSKYQVEQDTNNDRSENTNVKSEINKVNTNKRCQFLENIGSIKETSEQNSNNSKPGHTVFTEL